MSTDKKEPRSLRLTQAHRSDITNAVMKQWEEANPAPANGTFAEFIMELLPRLMKVRKNAPAEQKAFKHLIERTKSINTALEHLTDDNRKLVGVRSTCDINLQVILENGDKGALMSFNLPVEIANKLGIPYCSTTDTCYNIEPWVDLVKVHERARDQAKLIEVAEFPASNYNHTITIPRDDKTYVAYMKAQREFNKWENEKKKVREEIVDYLNQFNTTKQIREGWPELVDYLPAHLADPEAVIKLPALTRSRLNERLGLA